MVDIEKIFNSIKEPAVFYDESGKAVYENEKFKLLRENSEEEKYEVKVKKFDNFTLMCFFPASHLNDETYTDFISTVSHELRTPLTSIRGFADTMLFSYDKLDKTQIQKFLAIIKDQSNRLIKLIENLLAVSKMQTQNETLIYKAINLKSEIERILLMMKNQHKNHIFKFTCKDNVQPVLADESKFQQVIINLLDNAAKYSPENSTVEVIVCNSKSENCIDIKIKDEGAGIKEEDCKKIFEKFMRVENHLTRKAQGSGLGLYIVKNLIEKMGGKINVESEISKGSVFCVTLPAANYTSQSNKKILGRS